MTDKVWKCAVAATFGFAMGYYLPNIITCVVMR